MHLYIRQWLVYSGCPINTHWLNEWLNEWVVLWGHRKGESCPTYEREEGSYKRHDLIWCGKKFHQKLGKREVFSGLKQHSVQWHTHRKETILPSRNCKCVSCECLSGRDRGAGCRRGDDCQSWLPWFAKELGRDPKDGETLNHFTRDSTNARLAFYNYIW